MHSGLICIALSVTGPKLEKTVEQEIFATLKFSAYETEVDPWSNTCYGDAVVARNLNFGHNIINLPVTSTLIKRATSQLRCIIVVLAGGLTSTPSSFDFF